MVAEEVSDADLYVESGIKTHCATPTPASPSCHQLRPAADVVAARRPRAQRYGVARLATTTGNFTRRCCRWASSRHAARGDARGFAVSPLRQHACLACPFHTLRSVDGQARERAPPPMRPHGPVGRHTAWFMHCRAAAAPAPTPDDLDAPIDVSDDRPISQRKARRHAAPMLSIQAVPLPCGALNIPWSSLASFKAVADDYCFPFTPATAALVPCLTV